MAFSQIAASVRERPCPLLSADNGRPMPRHMVVDLLREAAPLLGLRPAVLATLEAMLSCLPPERGHHMVFASNKTLSQRLNGLSDRSIRRHAASLQEAGFLERRDSPNRKRFRRHSGRTGLTLRFGFDLSPLFARLDELAQLAATARQEVEHQRFLRSKLRAIAAARLAETPDDSAMTHLLKVLRRKLTSAELETLCAEQSEAPSLSQTVETQELTVNDSQSVRHYQKSKKELIDKTQDEAPEVTLSDLRTACPTGFEFAVEEIRTERDVVTQAYRLAPMVGIDRTTLDAATAQQGLYDTALTVWAMVQMQPKIRRIGAYFRAITSGAQSNGYNARRLIHRLAHEACLHPS